MKENKFRNDQRVLYIVGFIVLVVGIYIAQLANLQLRKSEYKDWADSNAFLQKTLYPVRGVIYDRKGELLVYNQPAHDVMVVMRETRSFDTLAFCRAVDIDVEYFRARMRDIKNRRLNPGYSSYTPQTFIKQLGGKESGILRESIYKFPGFYIQQRTVRQYAFSHAAHALGYVAEVSKGELEKDDYYRQGDYIGKTGVEKSYEHHLRGEKGVEILLRDAHGRVKGKYEEGIHDVAPEAGKDLTLSLDIELQAYGESLMHGMRGAIIMIQPKTGEILCMVSSPTYDPALLVGREFSAGFSVLDKDPHLPLLNRAMSGAYPPGSTFKTAQGLTFLQEGIITPNTSYPCLGGFPPGKGRPACHTHAYPIPLDHAVGTSCNSYFCYGLKAMLENKKYGSIQNAMDKWRDYMVAQGFGYRLGVDMPGEMRGLIPNSKYYNDWYHHADGRPWWGAMTIISNAIGQGEVTLSPMQICNLATTIANRGYFITPHIVKEIKDTPLDTLYTNRRYTGIDRQHYDVIARGMRIAVEGGPYGATCRRANIPDIAVCGKTGTAQNKGKDHSIFMGFAPYDDPEVSILVFVENGGFGATYAVPIGRLMIQKAIRGYIPDYDLPLEKQMKESVIPYSILHNGIQKN